MTAADGHLATRLRIAWAADEAPLPLDAVLLVAWAVARLAGNAAALQALVAVGAVVALRWPGTGLQLAIVAALLPARASGLSQPAVLLAGAAIGCLVLARLRAVDISPGWAGIAAAALVIITGASLAAVATAQSGSVETDAMTHWFGLVVGLSVLPIGAFLIRSGLIRPVWVAAGAAGVAVGLGILDGIAPELARRSPVGTLLSNVAFDRANGPFPSPNRLGTVAALVSSALAAIAIHRRDRWGVAIAMLALAALSAVLLSFSRGALLGLSVAAVVIVARRSVRTAALATAGVALIVLVAAPFFMNARLRFDPNPGRAAQQADDDAGRVDAWVAGVRMGVDAPLTGQGYGRFAVLSPAYGGPTSLANAHNETIGLFAETGIGGALSYLALLAACLLSFRSRSLAHDIGLAAILSFAVASSFNIQSIYPQVTVLLWLFVAWGLARGPTKVSSTP